MKTVIRAILTVIAVAWFMQDISARAAATLLPLAESCFQANVGVTGMLGALGTPTAGTLGVAGTYLNVPLTGGSGTGATANITVAGGGVTQVVVYNPGGQYVVGDVLSAVSGNIGGVSGFSVAVNSVTINSALSGGQVYFYIPNTSTFKTTWFNADQAAGHQNTNPVKLDQNGCAIIYGIGAYRQVLQDSLGNTIWDQITTDTSANNSTFWAGLAGGTPNAITVTDPGFNGTSGSIIQFTAISTNTGPGTVNPSGYGAIAIVKDTTGGPVALIGGEIIQNNQVSLLYNAFANTFTLLNPPILSPAASSAPLCGASGLRISNDTTSPTTTADIVAANAVMLSSAGQAINRSSVAQNINLTTNGAGGLDTGTVASGTIYNLFLIDNGAAPAGIASLSSSAPLLPANYSYVCRIAAWSTGTTTALITQFTGGNKTSITGSIPAAFINAGAGSPCPTLANVTFPVPLTATSVFGEISNSSGSAIRVATVGGPFIAGTATTATNAYFDLPLSTPQTISVCNSSISNQVYVIGWIDAINAN